MFKRIIEEKTGSTYRQTGATEDKVTVLETLTSDLIAKKLNNCTYIKSIKREPLYNGTQKIIVTYSNQVRAIYIINDH